MALPYQNSPPPNFPLEFNHDHQLFNIFMTTSQVASSSSSFSCPNSAREDHGVISCHTQKFHIKQDQGADQVVLPCAGSYNEERDRGLKFRICKKEVGVENGNESSGENNNNNSGTSSVYKWMPSKMRLMRKMMNNSDDQKASSEVENSAIHEIKLEDDHDQKQVSNLETNNNFNNRVRVCSDCNTSKTPLWRSGPRGPKSLCNACGIRQRKARRAAMAAAAANGTVISAVKKPAMKTYKVNHKEKKAASNGCINPQYKKKCKLSHATQSRIENKKLCFEDLISLSSKNSAFQRVFPQDEKEAAILLMALSYGLVHG